MITTTSATRVNLSPNSPAIDPAASAAGLAVARERLEAASAATKPNRDPIEITDDEKWATPGRVLLSRSYSTRERLEKAEAYGRVRNLRHLVLLLPSGRWTAVIVDPGWQPALNSGFAILG